MIECNRLCTICKETFLGHYLSKYCKKEKCQEKKLKKAGRNIEQYKNYTTEWRIKNPEKYKEQYEKWRNKNIEHLRKKSEKWRQFNPKKTKEACNLYRKYGTSKVSLEVKQMTALQQNLRKNFTQETIKQIEKGNTHEAYI